ncbi:MarR family winged helix-turn-helix transcriptional regulator [Rhodomicrobium sp. Az07]|uniref:MarR family winged helix-turn-helix transcriptional regulator n=1 Tax=Rhodomicrobium sp. Az07 TaxID=2839034 RepID=UPI001BE5AD1D|nr:MarR family winged helix-turn-helix transcriptional regulator [Rhodomicrobium sp. Az07]MBT3070911.1 MarR family winged helix-turn-helix transcriptional regulator [Rhodomicrobium sp. Az07]
MSNIAAPENEVPYEVTLHVRDTCLCLHVQRAARALARRFDVALKDKGITSGQFSLLMALNRPAAPRLGNVAALLAMDRTTLTANLKPLERAGYVEIFPDETDRRGRLLRLTEAGRSVLAGAVPIWQQTHAAVEADLGAARADRLREDLDAVSALDCASVDA